jgi:hypothetical protein
MKLGWFGSVRFLNGFGVGKRSEGGRSWFGVWEGLIGEKERDRMMGNGVLGWRWLFGCQSWRRRGEEGKEKRDVKGERKMKRGFGDKVSVVQFAERGVIWCILKRQV